MLTLELLNEADRLHDEINQLFSRGTSAFSTTANPPALNVWASDNELHVTAELPGIDPNEIDVSVRGDEFTLRGRFPARQLKEGERWIQQERASSTFIRTIRLPFRVESEKVEATYAHGVLTVRLPRAEIEKQTRIQIKAA